MTNKRNNHGRLPVKRLLTTAIGLALLSSQAEALEFNFGEADVSLDTTVAYGIGVRVGERDDDLVGKANLDPTVGGLPLEAQIAAPGRFSANSDDGNRNFDRGDLIFHQIRVLSELDVRYGDLGIFVRGNAFYDHEIDRHDNIPKASRDKAGKRARLLDAYLSADFHLGSKTLSTRFGRQVVSWGESTFISGGINTINPADVTQLRTAGAELRDVFIPLNMFWGSFDLTSNLSLEGVYLFEWDRVEAEPRGTFFSSNDFAVDGGQYAMLGFGRLPDTPTCPEGVSFDPSDSVPAACFPAGALPRTENNTPRDRGQWGIAARYYAPWFMDTEFGLYYLRYHSRLPLISGNALTGTDPTDGDGAGGRVIVEYPDNINLVGASFNTLVGTWSLAGEISYRNNVPLQIDDVEVLFAALSPLNPLIPEEFNRFRSQLGEFAPGDYVQGWERHQVGQGQFTLTRVYGPGNFLRGDQMVVVGEVGATWVRDLPRWDVLRYEGPGTDTGGGPSQTAGNSRNPVTETDGFPTSFSWGYRLVVAPTYNNAVGSWNLTPRLAFSHDVGGVSPGPGGNFIEDRMQATLGLRADYQARWRADLSYTHFWGAGRNNLLRDRDFAAFSLSYSF